MEKKTPPPEPIATYIVAPRRGDPVLYTLATTEEETTKLFLDGIASREPITYWAERGWTVRRALVIVGDPVEETA